MSYLVRSEPKIKALSLQEPVHEPNHLQDELVLPEVVALLVDQHTTDLQLQRFKQAGHFGH